MNVLAKGKRERQALEEAPVTAAIRNNQGRENTDKETQGHRQTGETQSQAAWQKNHSEKAKTPPKKPKERTEKSKCHCISKGN